MSRRSLLLMSTLCAAINYDQHKRGEKGRLAIGRLGSGAAEPVASDDSPLLLPLQASCRAAANRRCGPAEIVRDLE
jgi:hypothetical protein